MFIDIPNSVNKSDYSETDKIRRISKFKIIKTPSSYPEKRELMTQGCSKRPKRGVKEGATYRPKTINSNEKTDRSPRELLANQAMSINC